MRRFLIHCSKCKKEVLIEDTRRYYCTPCMEVMEVVETPEQVDAQQECCAEEGAHLPAYFHGGCI